MMRKITLLLTFIVPLFVSQSLIGQNPFWTLPNASFELGQLINPLPTGTSSPDYTGYASDYVHAGIKNPHGEIMFFIVDGQVYDRDGLFINQLIYNSNPITGNSEVIVINKPGSCSEFYIFLSGFLGNGNVTDETPFYAIFDSEDLSDSPYGSLVDWGGGNTALPIQGTIIESYADAGVSGLTQGVQCVNYAITKKRSDESRLVFIANNVKIYKLRLTCDGLFNTGWTHMLNGGWPYGYRSEMELHENSTNGHIRIAKPFFDSSSQIKIKIRLLELDQNGATISQSVQDINVGQGSSNSEPWVHGVEFAPDGNTLYFTHDPSATFNTTLSRYNYTSGIVQAATGLSGLSSFKNSQIQVGAFGTNDYRLWLTNGSQLGTIQDLGGGSFNWNPNVVQLGSYPVNYGFQNLGQNLDSRKLHIVPDQVDYDDYAEIFKETCDCCRKWNGDVIKYTATETDTWSPIFGNPITGTGSEVLIAEELRIPAGKVITIENMTFRFAPDARVVIERGSTGVNGGVLWLKNTTFTADFGCADRIFPGDNCPIINPTDICEKEYWEGVQIDGYSNLGQPGNIYDDTQQGRFIVEINSMIEYARQAVRIGRVSNIAYGGGILVARNSQIKDCLNGFKFHPYIRYSGGQEAMNRSTTRRMVFKTTSQYLFSGPDPERFIDVEASSGITISGCEFINEVPQSFQEDNRGIGVYASDSRLVINEFCQGGTTSACIGGTIFPSVFTNLSYGVNSVHDEFNYRLEEIELGKFINNKIGVGLFGSKNSFVYDNEFQVPRVPNNTGIFLSKSTNYSVERNYFTNVPGSVTTWSWGIAIRASGPFANVIKNNVFERITVGIISDGQNANPDDVYKTGLKYRCNQFVRATIKHSDILLVDGSISREQGECLGNDPSAPAGNLFSHSSALPSSHFDINVYPGVVALGYPINYYHHLVTNNPYVFPLRVSEIATGAPANYVLRSQCSSVYDSERDCDEGPIPTFTENATEAMETEVAPSILDMNSILSVANLFETNILELENQIDAGNTLELATLLQSEGNDEAVQLLLNEAGENLSIFIWDLLLKSTYSDLANELSSTLFSVSTFNEEGVLIETAVNEIEQLWFSARYARDRYWMNIAKSVAKDTLNQISFDDFFSLLNQFQPESMQGFAAAYALQNGHEIPEWVRPNFRPDVYNLDGYQLPLSATDEGLPNTLPTSLSGDFLNWSGNVSLLHSMYIAERKAYFPTYTEIVNNEEANENGKNAQLASTTSSNNILDIYPNPFTTELIFRFNAESPEYKELRIELFDLLGRRVKSERFGAGSIFTIDGLQLPKGMLTYTIFIDNAPVQNGKVVRLK